MHPPPCTFRRVFPSVFSDKPVHHRAAPAVRCMIVYPHSAVLYAAHVIDGGHSGIQPVRKLRICNINKPFRILAVSGADPCRRGKFVEIGLRGILTVFIQIIDPDYLPDLRTPFGLRFASGRQRNVNRTVCGYRSFPHERVARHVFIRRNCLKPVSVTALKHRRVSPGSMR